MTFTEVNVDLAVFPIQLLLTAYPALGHGQAMLDAPTLEPSLAADLDSQSGLQVVCKLIPSRDGPTVFVRVQDTSGNGQIILNFQDCGKERVVTGTKDVLVKDYGLVVLQDQPGQPFRVSGGQSCEQCSKSKLLVSKPILGR